MLSDEQLVRYNPWWRDPTTWRAEDPHLRRLAGRPIRLPTPVVERINLAQPAVHLLRGPRQVGKSTALKLLVERAMAHGFGARGVIYLALDLLEDQPAYLLVDTIARALALAGSESPPRLVLLDEVTAAAGWRASIKSMWDDGRLDRDVIVCTGSSAIDLARGATERLPGRRGAGQDHLVLPQDFGSFAAAIDESVPPGRAMTVEDMLIPDGQRVLQEARVHLPALQTALDRYLVFGGLPAAVAEAAQGLTHPSEETKRVLWDSIIREIQRGGASVPAAYALLERVMRSLGSKVSWSRLAAEMTVPLTGKRGPRRTGGTDPRKLQDYVELLALNYFVLVVYFWRQDSGAADLGRDKKLYFADPLLATITADRLALARDKHAEVENALALALYRRYESTERSAETFVAPEQLHVWATKRGEIDFVCGPRSAVEAVEVADRERVDRQKATAPMRSLPGRPAIVVSRDQLEFGRTANLVPTPLALWALSENPGGDNPALS